MVRSLTAFSELRGPQDSSDTGASRRTGFWRILELQHLDIKEVEDLLYGNKLLSGFMIVFLVGSYVAATILAFNYNYII